jgi:gluconolactonase
MRRQPAFLVLSIAVLGCGTDERADPGDTGQTAARHTIGSIERLDPAFDAIVPTDAALEVLADGHEWTEGPVWVPALESVLYSDIPNNAVYRWSEADGASLWLQPSGYTGTRQRGGEPGSNGLTLDRDGRLLLAQHGDRRIARLDSPWSTPEPFFAILATEYGDQRFNSPNDLAVHSSGAIYFTDPPYGLEGGIEDPARELDFQGVYRVDEDGSVALLVEDLSRPNGIAFSPDERVLYVANSDREQPVVMAYDVVPDGGVANGRVFFETWGDGMAVDERGNVYVAGPRNGVMVIAPDGTHLGTLLTTERTSNCTFGDDGSSLYITSDMYLLRIRLSVRGAD